MRREISHWLLGDSVPNYIRKRRDNPYEIRKYPGGDTCM